MDTNKVLMKSKIFLLEYAGNSDNKEYYQHFFDVKLDYRLIQSKGFRTEFVFFAIIPRIYEYRVDDSTTFYYLYNLKDSFLFAYNTQNEELYRLKGFKANDFNSLYYYCAFSCNMTHQYPVTPKGFFRQFSIDGVDLKCLYKAGKRNARNGCLREVRKINPGFSF